MDNQNQQPTDQSIQPDATVQTGAQAQTPKFEPLPIPQEVKIYLEAILEEAGLLIVTEEEKEQVLQNMYRQLDMFLLHTIIENLQEDKLELFTSLGDENPSTEKIQNFLQNELPNSQEIMQKAFEDFRELYLDTISAEEARMDAVLADESGSPTTLLEKLKYQDQIPQNS